MVKVKRSDKIVKHIGEVPEFKTTHDNYINPSFLLLKNAPDRKKEAKSIFKTVADQVKYYCETSTLHGLRYMGDSYLSVGERLFWFIAFAGAVTFAAYYITEIFVKWSTSPVFISFSPFDETFQQIPFPAITICNMNQAKKSQAERILRQGNNVEKNLLNTYCNANENSSIDFEQSDGPTGEQTREFLTKAGTSCGDLIKSLLWQNKLVQHEEFFTEDLTDEGLCCTFNRLPPEYILREHHSAVIFKDTRKNKKIFNWTMESSFLNETSDDLDVIPIRPFGAGTHLGMSVVLDVQSEEYFCSSSSSIGFKILFSAPTEMPRVEHFGFLVQPGVEIRLEITPDIRSATDNLRNVMRQKRQCFYQDERRLFYYRAYSQRNCNLECFSNYTLKMCECIPYYLPRSKGVSVCGQNDATCVQQARDDMELIFGNGSGCHCLAGCFAIAYGKSTSYGKLYQINPKYKLQNISQEYLINNIAIVNFYFQSTSFRKTQKSQIYGFIDAISNVGGLLGFCLGFSVLSLVELFYFITLRTFCMLVRAKQDVTGRIPFTN